MAWKPKTIAGKILKGAVIGGGSLLGLAAGVGAVGGVVKGTGALAGIGKGIGGIKTYVDKLGKGAVNLVTGTTAQQRTLINAQKDLTREGQQKLTLVEKLVRAGATVESARAQAGLDAPELVEYEGEKVKTAGVFDFLQSKQGLYIGLGLAALFLLPKILKRR